MKRILTVIVTLLAGPAFADGHVTGDADAGEAFFKKCQACHVVKNEDGETLAGKNGRTGPNLFGIVGSTAGTVDGFRYGKSMVAASEAGLVWDEANFVAYLADPTKFLRAFLDGKKARSNMSLRVKKEEDAKNLYAFFAKLAE